MRIHTRLSRESLEALLARAKDAGLVADDVRFVELTEHRSQSAPAAYEVQLGTLKSEPYRPLPDTYVNQYGKRQRTRRSSANNGHWAATWHETGWFLAGLFEADPKAKVTSRFANYHGEQDFSRQTRGVFN